MSIPDKSKYVIVGAGIHGLSTAYHLALLLKARRLGSGRDIVVLDKTGVAAGASGIACGVVRNNYFQPAMRELMAHSVEVWESDPGYSYYPVGYMQISPEPMHGDVAAIHSQQKAIGYDSDFIEGEADCDRYMKRLFGDWQAKGITSVLHEKRGGYATNAAAIRALARKAEVEGVRLVAGVTVTGFTYADGVSSAIKTVETDRGAVACDYVIVAAGPWVRDFWTMLELPETVAIKGPDGHLHEGIDMWRFWQLEEGVLAVAPDYLMTDAGQMPPVLHVDTDAPLHSDSDGRLITDRMWGIYYKPDFHFKGVQGGAMPYRIDKPANEVAIDPYGPASPEFVSSERFADMWCSALAFCHRRFEGKSPLYRREPSGGIGCFTPDSFPVLDVFRENCFVIADSNHGYKMLGVGKLVAGEIMGERSALLEPFRFSRYAEGKLHPVSNSPFPWS